MNLRRLILLAFLGCLAGLFEATTSTFLPQPFADLRPILPVLVCFIILQRPANAYVFALSAGMVLDLFSIGPTTLAFARLLAVALIVAVVAERVLTNHSLYASLALTVLARTLDWLWLGAAQEIARFAGAGSALIPGWQSAGWMLLFDAAIIAGAFVVNHVFFKRFVAFRLAQR